MTLVDVDVLLNSSCVSGEDHKSRELVRQGPQSSAVIHNVCIEDDHPVQPH